MEGADALSPVGKANARHHGAGESQPSSVTLTRSQVQAASVSRGHAFSKNV